MHWSRQGADTPARPHPPRRRPTAILAAVVIMGGMAPLSTPGSADAEPATTTVNGQVVDADTGRPLPGAVVHVTEQTSTVRTDADGRFTVPEAPVDALALVAARQGYSFGWHPLEDPNAPVTLALEAETPDTVPHPDYPRPDFDRRAGVDGQWASLNGTWSLDFDPSDVGVDEGWHEGDHEWAHAVRVPFAYNSLAGIGEERRAGNQVYASQFAEARGTVWYQRDLTVPEDWPTDRGTLLRFGAVEWRAEVFLDGNRVGENDGGYSPFDVDLGPLRPGAEHSLVVRVEVPDNSATTPYPQGKQMGWYTDTGGIWQSVWIEPADSARLTTVHTTPEIDFDGREATAARVTVDVEARGAPDGTVELAVRAQDGEPGARAGQRQDGVSAPGLPVPVEPTVGEVVATATVTLVDGAGSAVIDVPDPRLWEPEAPWLYRVDASLTDQAGSDRVDTWFGLRTVSREWLPGHSPEEQDDPAEQYQYLFLNNRPVYLRSVLDQNFNPWGNYSYTGLYQGADLRGGELEDPGKGSVLFDLALTKQLGFNSVRPHIKVNDPLYYHWADVLGLLVWYDQPNFGYDGYGPEAERLWEEVLRDAVHRDYNHPSIVIWDAFNEAWGFNATPGGPIRDDAKPWIERMFDLTTDLVRGTRLVVDNSPCCENGHLVTDINDFHGYYSTWEEWAATVDRIVSNTYPGSTHNFEDGRTQSGQPLMNSEFGPWSGGREKDQEVATPFRYTAELFRAEQKMSGYLFTELTDLEWEWNGWAAYDRTLQVPGYLDADGAQGGVGLANADDVLLVGERPVQRLVGDDPIGLVVRSSLFSGRDLGETTLRWRVTGTDGTGAELPSSDWAEVPVSPETFAVTELTTVEVRPPDGFVAGRLDAELLSDGQPVASGQTVLAAWGAAAEQAAGTLALDPAGADVEWPQGSEVFSQDGASAVVGWGDGEFRWHLTVPEDLRDGGFDSAQLVLEAAASRPSLPRTSFPQTSERVFPTTLSATVSGAGTVVETEAVVLPDDPADARGALSHESGFHPGQYGYRVLLDLDVEDMRAAVADGEVTVTLRGAGGGLTVLGPRTGRFGVPPQLVLSEGAGLPGPAVAGGEPYLRTAEAAGVTTHLLAGDATAGAEAAMTVSVVNDSGEVVRDVRPAFVAPEGWTVEALGDHTVGELAPGEGAHLRYRVVPDGDGPVTVRTRAYYSTGEGRQVTEEPWELDLS
ncbi:NPCBM-associated, NEW3 domain of alpha-galactosidase [Actinoalloteichus cyanogriseus DSM 43889]|uniref:NPCBM-associated, NEW3 domain of alpha-galactosidase n=2 Tax=Actinoalloteichus cyanogriseus TaxID=2893586 RepID=A0ABT1JE05_ACTCY|nr:NPCBM-associated, NEW3 domain of alpha-galactosidase [Actinoalloteichus caeruleus DSM 43889]